MVCHPASAPRNRRLLESLVSIAILTSKHGLDRELDCEFGGEPDGGQACIHSCSLGTSPRNYSKRSVPSRQVKN
jgi:hypothetical protein